MQLLLDKTPCIPEKVTRQVEGSWMCVSSRFKLVACYLLFDPEDGGRAFLRNVNSSSLHGLTSQTIVLLTGTAVRTSNLTDLYNGLRPENRPDIHVRTDIQTNMAFIQGFLPLLWKERLKTNGRERLVTGSSERNPITVWMCNTTEGTVVVDWDT